MTDTIHIDVRRMSQQTGADPYQFVVEASTDGAGFSTQYVVPLQTGETIAQCQTRAEDIARVFVAGCRYAGRDVRATSGGYGL